MANANVPNTVAIAMCDIPLYSGDDKSYPLDTWISSIRLAGQINQWPVDQMLNLVRARVSGTAARKLQSIPRAHNFNNLEHLISELQNLFTDRTSVDARLEELYRFGQRPTESIGQLGDRVRSIITAASGATFDEVMAVRAFCSALSNGNVKFDLRRNPPADLREAVAKAESFDREWKTCFHQPQMLHQQPMLQQQQQRFGHYQPAEPMEVDQMAKSATVECYYCQKQGHIGSSCLLLKQHMALIRRYEARLSARGRGRGRGRGNRQPARRRPFLPRSGQPQERSVREIMEMAQQIQQMEADFPLDEQDFEDAEYDEDEDVQQQQQQDENQQAEDIQPEKQQQNFQ